MSNNQLISNTKEHRDEKQESLGQVFWVHLDLPLLQTLTDPYTSAQHGASPVHRRRTVFSRRPRTRLLEAMHLFLIALLFLIASCYY